jgi:hypothetical protein
VVPQVGTAGRWKTARQCQKEGNAFHRAWVHHGDEAIVEAAYVRKFAGLMVRPKEGDGQVHRVQAAPPAGVLGDVLTDGHNAIRLPQDGGFQSAGKGSIRPERQGHRGAHQVDHAGAGAVQGRFQHQMRRVVRGGQDRVRIEGRNGGREPCAYVRLEREDTHLDAVQMETDTGGVGAGGNGAAGQVGEQAALSLRAEAVYARGNQDVVAPGGQAFHEQTVGFVASSKCRIVGRVVSEEDTHQCDGNSSSRASSSRTSWSESPSISRSKAAYSSEPLRSNSLSSMASASAVTVKAPL